MSRNAGLALLKQAECISDREYKGMLYSLAAETFGKAVLDYGTLIDIESQREALARKKFCEESAKLC